MHQPERPAAAGSASGSDDESEGPPSLGPESGDEDEMPPLVPDDRRPHANASDSDDEPPSLESDGEADIPVFTNAKREDVRNHAGFARPDLVAMSQQGESLLQVFAADCSVPLPQVCTVVVAS